MKWTDGLKEQLKELAFAEKSNKEIAEIMDIPLKDVHAGRSRFGLTIAKVKEMKEKKPATRTKEDIKNEVQKLRAAKEAAYKKIKQCNDRIEGCNDRISKLYDELFLLEISKS